MGSNKYNWIRDRADHRDEMIRASGEDWVASIWHKDGRWFLSATFYKDGGPKRMSVGSRETIGGAKNTINNAVARWKRDNGSNS